MLDLLASGLDDNGYDIGVGDGNYDQKDDGGGDHLTPEP